MVPDPRTHCTNCLNGVCAVHVRRETPPSPEVGKLIERLRVRIHALANRGANVCEEWQQPSDGGVSCYRCAYQRDVHLVRDALSALAASEADAQALREENKLKADPPLSQHAIRECNEAHVALDKLGVTKTRQVANRELTGKQEITLGLKDRIREAEAQLAEVQTKLRIEIDHNHQLVADRDRQLAEVNAKLNHEAVVSDKRMVERDKAEGQVELLTGQLAEVRADLQRANDEQYALEALAQRQEQALRTLTEASEYVAEWLESFNEPWHATPSDIALVTEAQTGAKRLREAIKN